MFSFFPYKHILPYILRVVRKNFLILGSIFFIFLLPSFVSANTVSYYIYDLPGRTVTGVSNNTGNIVATYEYDAFGQISYTTTHSTNNFLYVSEQRDAETNLIYLRNRYYAPALGRFISKDPLPGVKQIPQTENPYPYCGNNPLNFLDPLGLDYRNYNFSVSVGTITGALIGALLTGGNPIGTVAGAVLGSVGVTGGAMQDTETYEWYPYLGLSISPSVGPERSFSVTRSTDAPSAGWGISGSLNALLSAQLNYAFGEGFSREEGVGVPLLGISGSLTYTWGPISIPALPRFNDIIPFRDNCAYAAEISPANFGGVSLSKTATLLTDLSEIKGAVYDDKTGQIILVGKQNTALPQMPLNDLAVAANSVYAGTDPGVSIDPPLVNNQFSVRYEGRTANTEFGYIMFESDRIMKTLSLGRDNRTGAPVSSSVTGYKNMLDRYRESQQTPGDSWTNRFWFVPKEMKLVKSEDGESMVFEAATMEVLTESKFQDNEISVDLDFLNMQNVTRGQFWCNPLLMMR